MTYVWVDALTNYVTASGAIDPGAPGDRRGFGDARRPSWWPCDVHLMGKDILTTHAVYWPTLLMGAGLPLPRKILAHGWWVVGDTKMSKSLGNVVDPLDLRELYGTDAVRWYLMREMPTGHDASYTPDRFLARYDELRNILGNLAHRSLSMVKRYRGGTVPDAPTDGLAQETGHALAAYRRGLEGYRFHEGFAAAMDLARAANGFVEAREPWALARDPARAGELDETLATLVRTLSVLAAMFEPAIPAQALELSLRLGLKGVPHLGETRPDRPRRTDGNRRQTPLSARGSRGSRAERGLRHLTIWFARLYPICHMMQQRWTVLLFKGDDDEGRQYSLPLQTVRRVGLVLERARGLFPRCRRLPGVRYRRTCARCPIWPGKIGSWKPNSGASTMAWPESKTPSRTWRRRTATRGC